MARNAVPSAVDAPTVRRSTRSNPNPNSPLRPGLETPHRKRSTRSKSGDPRPKIPKQTKSKKTTKKAKGTKKAKNPQRPQSSSDSQQEFANGVASHTTSSDDATTPTLENNASAPVEEINKTNIITIDTQVVTVATSTESQPGDPQTLQQSDSPAAPDISTPQQPAHTEPNLTDSTPSGGTVPIGHPSPLRDESTVESAQQTTASPAQNPTPPAHTQHTTDPVETPSQLPSTPSFFSRLSGIFSSLTSRRMTSNKPSPETQPDAQVTHAQPDLPDTQALPNVPVTPLPQINTTRDHGLNTAPALPLDGGNWLSYHTEGLSDKQKTVMRRQILTRQAERRRWREHNQRQNEEFAQRLRESRKARYMEENRKRIEEFEAEEAQKRAGEKRKRYLVDDFVKIPHKKPDQPSGTFALVDDFFDYDSEDDEDVVELYERDIDIEGQPSKRRMINLYDEEGNEAPRFLSPENTRPILREGAQEVIGVKRSSATMDAELEMPASKKARVDENPFITRRKPPGEVAIPGLGDLSTIEEAGESLLEDTPIAKNGPTLTFTFTYSDSDTSTLSLDDNPTKPPPPPATLTPANIFAAEPEEPVRTAPSPPTTPQINEAGSEPPTTQLSRARAEATRHAPARPSGLRIEGSPLAVSAPASNRFASIFPPAKLLGGPQIVLNDEQKARACAAFADVLKAHRVPSPLAH